MTPHPLRARRGPLPVSPKRGNPADGVPGLRGGPGRPQVPLPRGPRTTSTARGARPAWRAAVRRPNPTDASSGSSWTSPTGGSSRRRPGVPLHGSGATIEGAPSPPAPASPAGRRNPPTASRRGPPRARPGPGRTTPGPSRIRMARLLLFHSLDSFSVFPVSSCGTVGGLRAVNEEGCRSVCRSICIDGQPVVGILHAALISLFRFSGISAEFAWWHSAPVARSDTT